MIDSAEEGKWGWRGWCTDTCAVYGTWIVVWLALEWWESRRVLDLLRRQRAIQIQSDTDPLSHVPESELRRYVDHMHATGDPSMVKLLAYSHTPDLDTGTMALFHHVKAHDNPHMDEWKRVRAEHGHWHAPVAMRLWITLCSLWQWARLLSWGFRCRRTADTVLYERDSADRRGTVYVVLPGLNGVAVPLASMVVRLPRECGCRVAYTHSAVADVWQEPSRMLQTARELADSLASYDDVVIVGHSFGGYMIGLLIRALQERTGPRPRIRRQVHVESSHFPGNAACGIACLHVSVGEHVRRLRQYAPQSLLATLLFAIIVRTVLGQSTFLGIPMYAGVRLRPIDRHDSDEYGDLVILVSADDPMYGAQRSELPYLAPHATVVVREGCHCRWLFRSAELVRYVTAPLPSGHPL